jgi:hypothetical protein
MQYPPIAVVMVISPRMRAFILQKLLEMAVKKYTPGAIGMAVQSTKAVYKKVI